MKSLKIYPFKNTWTLKISVYWKLVMEIISKQYENHFIHSKLVYNCENSNFKINLCFWKDFFFFKYTYVSNGYNHKCCNNYNIAYEYGILSSFMSRNQKVHWRLKIQLKCTILLLLSYSLLCSLPRGGDEPNPQGVRLHNFYPQPKMYSPWTVPSLLSTDLIVSGHYTPLILCAGHCHLHEVNSSTVFSEYLPPNLHKPDIALLFVVNRTDAIHMQWTLK